MDPFPLELWDCVLANLKPRELIALSAACRFLRSVAEAIIYGNIDLTMSTVSKIHKFRSALSHRLYLGELVHKMSIHTSFAASPQMLHLHLAFFPNLRDLWLQEVVFDAWILSTIFRILPRLHTLHLSGPNITSDPIAPQGDTLNTKAISLRSLHIRREISLANSTDALLAHFTQHGYSNALTTLKLEVNNRDIPYALLPFLLSAPSLAHISLPTCTPTPSHPIYTLPADAIPHLVHFAGSSACAAVFVHGRPVSSIAMDFSPHDADFRPIWEASTVPVTSLKVNCSLQYWHSAPPTLRNLICRTIKKAILLASIPHWPPMPALECVSGTISEKLGGAFSCQEEIVHAVSTAYPSVRECVFFLRNSPQVGNAWVKLRDGQWECRRRF